VTDDKGAPMSGVTVSVVGRDATALTDNNGNFSIQVAEGARSLRFSYVGYESADEVLAGRSVLNVTLKPGDAGLEEVVVVGYTTQKRKEATGSIASV
jgi:hypothetical protein